MFLLGRGHEHGGGVAVVGLRRSRSGGGDSARTFAAPRQSRGDHRDRRAGEALAEGYAVERRRVRQARDRADGGARPDPGPAPVRTQRPDRLEARHAHHPRPEQRGRARRASSVPRRGPAAHRGPGRRADDHLQRIRLHPGRAVGRRPCRGVPDPANHDPGRQFDRWGDLHPYRGPELPDRGAGAADRGRAPPPPGVGGAVHSVDRRPACGSSLGRPLSRPHFEPPQRAGRGGRPQRRPLCDRSSEAARRAARLAGAPPAGDLCACSIARAADRDGAAAVQRAARPGVPFRRFQGERGLGDGRGELPARGVARIADDRELGRLRASRGGRRTVSARRSCTIATVPWSRSSSGDPMDRSARSRA